MISMIQVWIMVCGLHWNAKYASLRCLIAFLRSGHDLSTRLPCLSSTHREKSNRLYRNGWTLCNTTLTGPLTDESSTRHTRFLEQYTEWVRNWHKFYQLRQLRKYARTFDSLGIKPARQLLLTLRRIYISDHLTQSDCATTINCFIDKWGSKHQFYPTWRKIN